MDKKKVDICMCIYNSNEYLERIINNIYGQTFSDFNLIISDSAPNANLIEFIMSLKKEKNNVFYFQSLTPGYINNLNNALINSVSDYICFVDPDDYISENKLEEQVKYLDSHKDVDIVSCMTFLSSNMALANTCADLNHENISNFIDSNSGTMKEICHFQSCMIRRSCLEKFINKKFFFDEYEGGLAGEGFLYTLYYLGYKFGNTTKSIYFYLYKENNNGLSKRLDPLFAKEIDKLDSETRKEEILNLFNKYNPVKKKRGRPKKS